MDDAEFAADLAEADRQSALARRRAEIERRLALYGPRRPDSSEERET
jgi:hypothetical protein